MTSATDVGNLRDVASLRLLAAALIATHPMLRDGAEWIVTDAMADMMAREWELQITSEADRRQTRVRLVRQ